MAKKSKGKGKPRQNNSSQKKAPQKTGLKTPYKILIVVGIVVVIGGLFVFKNAGEKEPDVSVLEVDTIPLELTSVDLDEILSHNLPVIIDFGADSCIPCKDMAPVLKKLNEELQGEAVIHFVDVWKNSDAATGFPLRVIPTQVFIMPDASPYVPSEGLEKELGIEFAIYNHKDTEEHIFTTHEGGLNEEQMRRILEDMGVTV